MKKKQVIVVKKLDKMSPKKEIFVSKKVQNFDPNDHEWKESFVGNPAPQRPIRDAHENILSRSILGDPKVFESFVDLEDVPPSPVTPVKRKVKNSEATAPAPAAVSNKKKSVLIQPSVKLDPKIHPGLYLESLQKLKMKAAKLREKELEKETKLIQYLPVNERFDLNKEGKVLAMWQERQKKWAQIQKSLAKRVGGTTESLMMNTGDEFRARNEEYDVLQAAIPVHERFGSESWKMMLRGGTERSVSIGHVFSGLSCPISIKSTIPAIIRKPRVSGQLKKGNTFIDPTPSLLKRQKQLQKTLQSLRPHSLGPSEVEGFIISSQNLFDWAIQSSEKYFQEKQDLASPSAQIVTSTDEKAPSVVEEYSGPEITFLSPRNILFHGLQGETVNQTITFKNTGSSALTFIWKSVPEKELHEPSDVAQVMCSRNEQPRAHILSRERSPFFCSHPSGQILPGDTIETVFSFCSKGSGGNFFETWILDTSPRAVIQYPPTFSKPSLSDVNQTTSRSQSSVPLPSTVYVKLKGHSYTLDEGYHRRESVLNNLEKGSLLGNMIDQTYLMIRKVRQPVTKLELSNRKIRLFQAINETILRSFSPLFEQTENIKLTPVRLDSFIQLWSDVALFGDTVAALFEEKLQLLIKSESRNLSGISRTNFDEISLFLPLSRAPQAEIRNSLFPENTIEIFDEVTEEMITSNWNYNLTELNEYIEQLLQAAETIQNFDEKTNKNLHLIEKARIFAERKAQDSDYEDEDEEEPELDETEESDKPKSVLFKQVESLGERLRQLILLLLIEPLPHFSQSIYSALSDSMKDIEGFQARSLENAGLKGDLIISPIMSPFTTEEGNETWQSVLTSRLPVQGKKPPAPKAQKGYASDEQRKKYYLSMYELVSGALLDGICQGISEIDTKMNDDYEQRLDRVGYSSLESSSAVRSDDLISKNPVFLTFNGKCFGSLLPSAFDVATSLKLALTSTLFQFAEYGADLIVLLFESAETVNSLADAASEVASLLRAYTEKLPKRKNRQSITFTTKYISSMAELDFYLENQMKISQNPRPVDCDRNVTVLLLENLSEASIVPKSPDYIEEVSDDEEDAIPIGISEYKEAKIKAWKALEPRNLPVSIQVLGKSYTINCLTDAAAALARLVLQYKAIVVQGDIGSFFPVSNSVLARSSFMNTLVTDRVRDSMNWLSVLLSFPKVSSLRSRENRSGAELYSFGDYLSYLFPNSISDPSLIFTIGGTIRSTKFRFLEYAIDLGNTIILCGEFCVPFLFASGVVFKRSELYSKYQSVCANLLAKARLRGVSIILPVDLVVGDECILPDHFSKYSHTTDKDSRDEGGDYEGDTTIVTCESHGTVISGYPLDLGPVSCQNIRSLISQHHLHLNWGTVGCCELSSFQSGQRSLVESSTSKPSTSSITHNLIIGESTVEWWSRISDSEGEFEGDLIKKGVVDLMCRDSSTFSSTISHLPSRHISTILRRLPNLDEWDYLTALRKEEEDPEEEEEEEEDD